MHRGKKHYWGKKKTKQFHMQLCKRFFKCTCVVIKPVKVYTLQNISIKVCPDKNCCFMKLNLSKTYVLQTSYKNCYKTDY